MLKPAMGRFHTTHQYVGERDNKFGEIHNLKLIKASHSKIFALVFGSNLLTRNGKVRIPGVITISQFHAFNMNFEMFSMCPKH